MSAASVNRTGFSLKAALNLAARQDERIISRRAWQEGLALIPNATHDRNVILADGVVRDLIAEAYNDSREKGLFVELAGGDRRAGRASIVRLEVRDLLDGSEPRLMMPASRKGKGRKAKSHYPVPISADLAKRLAAMDRSANAPLLTRPGGKPWRRSNQAYPFRRVASACGQDPAEVAMLRLAPRRHRPAIARGRAGTHRSCRP